MAKKKPSSDSDDADGDTEDGGEAVKDPVVVALERLRRSGRWRLLTVSVLIVIVGSGLGFELFRLHGEVAGMIERIEAVADRQEGGLARIGDQTASMRAGVELQRDDLLQIKRQLERLSRQ